MKAAMSGIGCLVLTALISVGTAHAASLSPGCASINSAKQPWVVSAGNTVQFVDDKFNVGERAQFKWSPSIDAGLMTYTYALGNEGTSASIDPGTFVFIVYVINDSSLTISMDNDDKNDTTTNVRGSCTFNPVSQPRVQQGSAQTGTGSIGNANQGSSVALSADGNTAIVGGPADNSGVGAAWVFTQSGGVWTQQAKLGGDDVSGNANLGISVALSADGNTAIVGGYLDDNDAGAAWIFTRSNGAWTQQGSKLVGTGATGAAEQGISVALSADGNTAIVGGFADNTNVGAAWVFVQNDGVWTQQGGKLVGSGAVGASLEGRSVALSADGNTAIIGGPHDNSDVGAAWVFSQSGGVWTQLGSKLIGTGNVGASQQGFSVALAGDGNTAVVGGWTDNSNLGAAWIFSQSGGVWTQQGPKLTGNDSVGTSVYQGSSVALSNDGNTAIVGGEGDNGSIGASWIFTRSSGGLWTQQGFKLTANDAVLNANQGCAIALSSDGKTALVGGYNNSFGPGAAWFFVSETPTNSHDFNGDGYSDILWGDTSGDVAMWLMNGTTVTQSSGVGNAPTNWSIVGQRDFNGDGYTDILWHDTSGDVAVWFMNGATISQSVGVGTANPSIWSIVGTGDFFGNGNGGILWRDTSGDVAIWELSGSTIVQSCGVGTAPTTWSIAGTGDFNGDGKTDILWHDTSGDVAIWEMNGCTILQSAGVGTANPSVWSIAGTGDFNGDGMSDILWHDTSGDVAIWEMNGAAITQSAGVGTANPSVWSIAQTGDYYGAGTSDILWRDTSGDVAVWQLNGATITQSAGIGTAPTVWSIQDAGAD